MKNSLKNYFLNFLCYFPFSTQEFFSLEDRRKKEKEEKSVLQTLP